MGRNEILKCLNDTVWILMSVGWGVNGEKILINELNIFLVSSECINRFFFVLMSLNMMPLRHSS